MAGRSGVYALVRAGGLPLLTLFAIGPITGGWLIARRSPASGSRTLRLDRAGADSGERLVGAAAACLLLLFIMVTVALLAKQRFWWLRTRVRGVGELSWRSAPGLRAARCRSRNPHIARSRTLPRRSSCSGPHAGRDGDAARAVLLGRNPELLARIRLYPLDEWRRPLSTDLLMLPFWILAAAFSYGLLRSRHRLRQASPGEANFYAALWPAANVRSPPSDTRDRS